MLHFGASTINGWSAFPFSIWKNAASKFCQTRKRKQLF